MVREAVKGATCFADRGKALKNSLKQWHSDGNEYLLSEQCNSFMEIRIMTFLYILKQVCRVMHPVGNGHIPCNDPSREHTRVRKWSQRATRMIIEMKSLPKSSSPWVTATSPGFSHSTSAMEPWQCLWSDTSREMGHWRQNHRMVWVGNDLKDHLVPTLCHVPGHLPLDQVAQSPVNLSLKTSRDGDSTTSLSPEHLTGTRVAPWGPVAQPSLSQND